MVWERNKFICFHDRLADGSIKENINNATQDGDKNQQVSCFIQPCNSVSLPLLWEVTLNDTDMFFHSDEPFIN